MKFVQSVREFANICVLTTALAACAVSWAQVPAKAASTAPGTPRSGAAAAAIALAITDGGEAFSLRSRTLQNTAFDSATLRGKPTVVMYWHTDCMVCKSKMADLRRVADEGSVHVVTVATDSDPKGIHDYAKMKATLQTRSKINQIWTGTNGYADNLSVKPQRLPTTLMIDAKGVIRERIEGRFDDQALARVATLR